MAAPSGNAHRIDVGLRSLELMIADLPAVAADWPQMDDMERASWSLDWDQQMYTNLGMLDEYCRGHEMTPNQHQQYRRLLLQLKQAMPTIEQLPLTQPTVPIA